MKSSLRLLAANKGVGHFQAKISPSKTTLFLFDAIASDRETAELFGGTAPEDFSRAVAQSTGDIDIFVNSPGGCVFGGQAMAASIKRASGRVRVFVDGLAASAATVVAAAADEVIMSSGSFFMIHNAWTGTIGNARDMRESADLLETIDTSLVEQYVQRTGQTTDAIRAMVDAETWLDADRAVELGFADRVEGAPSNDKTAFDLSAYAKAPSQLLADKSERELIQTRLRLASAMANV